MSVFKVETCSFSIKSILSYISWMYYLSCKDFSLSRNHRRVVPKEKQTQKETKKTKKKKKREIEVPSTEGKRPLEEETHSYYGNHILQRATCLIGTRCLYWAPLPPFSQGELSQVHSNACFISPLILIKRILSRLLGINIDRFWYYSCAGSSGLLFQGSCTSFSFPYLLFGI